MFIFICIYTYMVGFSVGNYWVIYCPPKTDVLSWKKKVVHNIQEQHFRGPVQKYNSKREHQEIIDKIVPN